MTSIRIYINIVLVVFLSGLVFSCHTEDVISNGENANVKLTLELGRQGRADVTEDGVDNLNENLMKSVDFFFYLNGSTFDDEPVYSSVDVTLPENTKGTAEVNISMPVNEYNALFANADECEVYVIVNRSESDVLPESKTRNSLKNMVLLAEGFAERTEKVVDEALGTTIYLPTVQDCFVMDGQSTLTLSGSTLTGTIPVERVATKISLLIEDIADEVTDNNGDVWNSDKESIRISLRRGSKRTKLGSTPTEYIYSINKELDIFSIDAVSLDHVYTATVNDEVKNMMTTSVPFYTYPTNWIDNDNARTHFIIVVEWINKNDTNEKLTTYYEVNVNAGSSYVQRNRYYKINQEIGVLGSTDPETPVQLYPCSYLILPWGSSMDDSENTTNSNGELSRLRYLVVNETNVVLNNEASRQIPFFSSDPIDISSVTVQWEYTGEENPQMLTFATKDHANKEIDDNGDVVYTIENPSPVSSRPNRIQGDYIVELKIHQADPEIPEDVSYIYVEHQLNNNMTANADYTPYTITFVVEHEDEENYNETIKITQYPMIAIEAEHNDGKTNGGTNDNYGGVWVNNSRSNYGGVHGLTGGNKNPNRYIISVSALDEGSAYIIGDPRQSRVNNLNTNFSSATTMKYPGDTNNRRLSYYHPTESGDRTVNMVSPQFMIASSYGVTEDIGRDNANRRCASYQEDGYPAGRWRVPTQAEITYIVQLSAWGIIPRLFGSETGTTNYWSANGGVAVNTTYGTVGQASTMNSGPVRCVYDTWYWKDKCDDTQFTWGDKAVF